MGLLSAAFLQGAGQGLNVLGQGMLRGIEREDEQELWEKRTKLLAEIQRESAKGIRDDQAAHDDARFPVKLEQETQTVAARGKAQTAADVARANDSGMLAAEAAQAERNRGYKSADAEAAAESARKATVAAGSDKAYLQAQTAIKLADPEVAARIAAARASAASAGASAGLARAQTEGVNLTNQDKKTLNGLYDDASAILSDTEISDAERGKQMLKIQQQIGLIKSKTGQGTRDPELDTETITTEKENPDGSTTKTTRKEVRKPGQRGSNDEADPVKAAMDAARAAKAKSEPPAKTGMLGPREPAPNKTDKPTFDYLQAPDLSPAPRLQQLEKLEEQNRLTPMQAAELKALRGGR